MQPRLCTVAMAAVALTGLSAAWESAVRIRTMARETNKLVKWPSPMTVGIASMLPA